MQFKKIFLIFLAQLFRPIFCAPTDTQLVTISKEPSGDPRNINSAHSPDSGPRHDKIKVDHYEHRHLVAEGVQKALDECREKFKWDPWNCPKKAFLDILDRNSLPTTKEIGLVRALIASGIVISLTRSCSYGNNNLCGCSNQGFVSGRPQNFLSQIDQADLGVFDHGALPARGSLVPGELPNGGPASQNAETEQSANESSKTRFIWRGCDEAIKFGFKVSKIYLEAQDLMLGESSRIINSHNYEVGRLAVRNNMKKMCKCHGISGSCQVKTCWTAVPEIGKVGSYIKRMYRRAAKVGALTAEDTEVSSLSKELSVIKADSLVFAEPSPDYCYENLKHGINGTLGRLCNPSKRHADGTEVIGSERDSCDRLCTKCGYKIKREHMSIEKQCDCRFVYCCSVECKRCPQVEDTFRCAKHS